MNKALKLSSTVAISLIFMAITVAMFLAGKSELVALDYRAMIFVLIPEVLIFAYLLFLNLSSPSSSKLIIRMGIVSTLGICWVVTALLALFRKLFAENVNIFTAINVVVLGVAAVICILINLAAVHVQNSNEKSKLIDNESKRGEI